MSPAILYHELLFGLVRSNEADRSTSSVEQVVSKKKKIIIIIAVKLDQKRFFMEKEKKRGGMIEAFGEYLLRPPV